jgi:hypothetical protein
MWRDMKKQMEGQEAPTAINAPESWPVLLEIIERPEKALALRGPEWDEFLAGLRNNSLLPLAYHALKKGGWLGRLEARSSAELETAMVRYRAGWAASWNEIDRLLAAFVGRGLHPIPIKGVELSIRAYPEPHLRPISDLDVLFPSLPEADQAYSLLEELGYRNDTVGLAGDKWTLSHHLPQLVHSKSKFPVEVHGALVWAPKDARWESGACRLMERREGFVYKGLPLEGLAAEANLVFLFAHMFLHHSDTPPKAMVLFDARYLVERAGERFNWNRALDLARAAKFQTPVYEGLALAKQLLKVPVPAETLESLAAEAEITRMPMGDRRAQKTLAAVVNMKGLAGSVKLGWNLAVPPRAFIRDRYPECARWPIWALYPYRWWDQTKKIASWILAKALSRGA